MYVRLHVKGLFPLSAIGMAVHLFHVEIQIDCDEASSRYSFCAPSMKST